MATIARGLPLNSKIDPLDLQQGEGPGLRLSKAFLIHAELQRLLRIHGGEVVMPSKAVCRGTFNGP